MVIFFLNDTFVLILKPDWNNSINIVSLLNSTWKITETLIFVILLFCNVQKNGKKPKKFFGKSGLALNWVWPIWQTGWTSTYTISADSVRCKLRWPLRLFALLSRPKLRPGTDTFSSAGLALEATLAAQHLNSPSERLSCPVHPHI